MTLKQYLIENNLKQADFVRFSGIDRKIVSQAVSRGHTLVINSLGEYVLVPKTYARAFI